MIVPAWLNLAEYPFKSHYLKIGGHEMHYVDEGQGQTILFLHDLPLWSFQYRQVIKGLMDQYRCIAPDFMGFGLSDKPENLDYSLDTSLERLISLTQSLQLENLLIIGQGWSSHLALAFAERFPTTTIFLLTHPELPHPFHKGLRISSRLSPLYPKLVRPIIKSGFLRKSKAPQWLLDHYALPFQQRSGRKGLQSFVMKRLPKIHSENYPHEILETPVYYLSEEDPEGLIILILSMLKSEIPSHKK